jgi:3-deoxy-manno-octulosonate cytidylyltransferase (CMP-KDO synthetase)
LKVIGIIPARYGSIRLEGKPLLDIAGKTMIRRVYERAILAKKLTKVIVATDHQDIFHECEKYSIPVMMTSRNHLNGTERCGEVISKIEDSFDIIINIQGDEPFIHPESIDELISIFENKTDAEIGTLFKLVYTEVKNLDSSIANPSMIKLVTDKNNKAQYFSRSLIPYYRDINELNSNNKLEFKQHIGMYGFRATIFRNLLELAESNLEKSEKLEQLRWLENGYSVYVAETKFESKSIDTIEDYNYVINNISKFINE